MLIDKLKDKERSKLDTSDNDFSIDKIKNNKKTGQSTTDNCIRNDKNETILRNDLALNDQNDKRESLVQNSSNISVPSKKLKRRFQKTVNRIKTNENISARDSPFRSKSTTQFNAVMPELLPCNIVNLNLDDLIENKNRPIERKTSETNDDETNQSSSRLIISEKPRKNVRNKRNTESRTKQQNNDDSSVELSSGKGRIVIEKDSSVETDYSTPVYEKFLSFNSSSSNGVNTPKSSIFEKDVKTKAERFDQKSDLGEESNKYFDDSLPLTGDPEIDEEIIAFYKAKRSGGIY